MTPTGYQLRDASGRLTPSAAPIRPGAAASQEPRRQIAPAEPQVHAPLAQPTRKRITRDDVIYFATQLAVMVDTGVPLSDSLDAIGQQAESSGMRDVILGVSEQVKSGTEFSAALERHPKVFGRLFIALMRASEASGTMGAMLLRISEYLEQERETRKKIKGAMTYPICMLSFCVVVVVALLTFVLPKFAGIYASKGAALPGPTRVLMTMSNGLVHYWPFVLLGAAGMAVGGYFYFRSPGGAILLDRVRISMPILGPMYRKACLARCLRTMATMVSTGVSMLEGLEITAQVAGNHSYSRIWRQVAEGVKDGSMLSEQLYSCKLVPRTITQMISAGEKTGKLGPVINRVAGFCESDLNVAVKTVTNMIEPVMIIVMGVLVGGIAISLLLPIFSISKVVAR